MSKIRRQLALTVTIQLLLELDTEGDSTQMRLHDARHSVLGTMQTSGDAADDPLKGNENYRQAMGLEAAKLGARWLSDKLEGRLEDAVPEVTQAGAMA